MDRTKYQQASKILRKSPLVKLWPQLLPVHQTRPSRHQAQCCCQTDRCGSWSCWPWKCLQSPGWRIEPSWLQYTTGEIRSSNVSTKLFDRSWEHWQSNFSGPHPNKHGALWERFRKASGLRPLIFNEVATQDDVCQTVVGPQGHCNGLGETDLETLGRGFWN